MSLDDRDWWREDRKKKEKLYGGDFSLHSRPKYRKMPDIKPKGTGNGCGNVFATIIVLVVIFVVALASGVQIPGIGLLSEKNSVQSDNNNSIISIPGKITFKREVPYREIDINGSFVTFDSGVPTKTVELAEGISRILLQNDNLLRQFVGNGWTVHLSDHELNGIGDVEHPAGYTDYKNRCIVIYAPHCEHVIFHEFGHYFAYIYECNFENIKSEMDVLYREEARNFVSYRGDQETKYGKKNVNEFFACMYDNMVHDADSSYCPKTENYIKNCYNILANTDYKDIYSVNYEYRVKLEELFQNYGATYTFILDGERIDPKTYDIHDFPTKGFSCQVSGANGTGTLVIQTYDIENDKITA
ncbi:hypothetical protein UYO_0157 [Lachnospiraceae bacterium JC7]|nr:hypothetical protein UYO_0157 [Lachnospiraceae bacterium JC7]